jgi:cytoskeleton protein RodZ
MTENESIEAELPLDTAGARLLRAREAAGLSVKQVAETTKIAERYLIALEQGNYGALPARTYATGFGRSYARAVGADTTAIVAAVREELAQADYNPPARAVQTFEPGDPSRLPSSALAWIAGLLALVLVVAALIWWKSGSASELPSLLPDDAPSAAATNKAADASFRPLPGPVVFTALAPDVWVKFYDGKGVQLLQKELAQGESFMVPIEVPDAMLWTARPEALAITVGGQPVAKLSEVQQMVKDVPVTAAALLARGASAAAPLPTVTDGAASPAARAGQSRDRTPAPRRPVRATEAAPVPTATVEPVSAPALQPAAAAPAPAAT